MYIYYDVFHGHFIIFHYLHMVLKLVEAAGRCCVYIMQYEDIYTVFQKKFTL